MVVPAQVVPAHEQFSEYYAAYVEGSYDCVDRIVMNAYFRMGQSGGGMRTWWRELHGSDEGLDTNHLIRYAGRFARRVRAYAESQQIPVIECDSEVRKHEVAEAHIPQDANFTGVFLILVSRFSAPIWEVQKSQAGKSFHLKKTYGFVKQYWFHILDKEWGHMTIRLSPHPPFGAQIFFNGHEYVARLAQKAGVNCQQIGNRFESISDPVQFASLAETLSSPEMIGRLRQACERWIYSSCLCFALTLDEQSQSRFCYQYSVYQLELSRNLLFKQGGQMEQIFQSVIDRLRSALDIKQIKTIFGAKHRPFRHAASPPPRFEVVVEKPTYPLTVFKVHFDHLTLKLYSKGARTLRCEVTVHNTKHLPVNRGLDSFDKLIRFLQPILYRFLDVLHGIETPFISTDWLDQLPLPSQLGQRRIAGINLDQPRMRTLLQAVLALAPSPNGFAVSELAAKVCQILSLAPHLYSTRQAAYDLKKLRTKQLVQKLPHSRRYTPTDIGLSAISALLVLREKVVRPVLAGAGKPKQGPKPKNPTPLDETYRAIQALFRQLFLQLGFAL
jgi:hypothetical protein